MEIALGYWWSMVWRKPIFLAMAWRTLGVGNVPGVAELQLPSPLEFLVNDGRGRELQSSNSWMNMHSLCSCSSLNYKAMKASWNRSLYLTTLLPLDIECQGHRRGGEEIQNKTVTPRCQEKEEGVETVEVASNDLVPIGLDHACRIYFVD